LSRPKCRPAGQRSCGQRSTKSCTQAAAQASQHNQHHIYAAEQHYSGLHTQTNAGSAAARGTAALNTSTAYCWQTAYCSRQRELCVSAPAGRYYLSRPKCRPAGQRSCGQRSTKSCTQAAAQASQHNQHHIYAAEQCCKNPMPMQGKCSAVASITHSICQPSYQLLVLATSCSPRIMPAKKRRFGLLSVAPRVGSPLL